jgi:hypothetical protein
LQDVGVCDDPLVVDEFRDKAAMLETMLEISRTVVSK